jgi:hypothetical protein
MSIAVDQMVLELDARCKKLEQRYDWLASEYASLRVEHDALCLRLGEKRTIEKRPNGRLT